LLRKIAKSTAWYLFEKVIRILVTFFVGLWLARYLGPSQYGILSYAIALIATLSFFASWGVESIVIRDFIAHPEKANEIASTYFYTRMFGALLVPLIAYGCLHFAGMDSEILVVITLILSLSVLCLSFDVADCYFQALGFSSRTSLIRAGSVIFGAFLKIALMILDVELWVFAFAVTLESMLLAVIYFLALKNVSISLSLRNWNQAIFKQIFFGGSGLILSAATVMVYSKIDVLVIGANFSESILGNYSIAASMCSAWNLLGVSICQAFAPYITRAKNLQSLDDYHKILRNLLLLMLFASLLGSIVLSFIAEPLFSLVLGEEYALGANYFSWLIWISIPTFLGIATSQIIVNEQQYWVSLFRTAIGLSITLLLIYPALNIFGVPGVIAVLIFSSCINTPLVLVSSRIRKALIPALSLKSLKR
jgi:PST family polysaccharide transporter